MGNRVITLLSFFTTIFFLMLTCALGYILYIVGNPNENSFWFIAPFFIGMFIATLVCIGNIKHTVNLSKSRLDKVLSNDANMTTCPNYWMKQIVFDPATKKRSVMCYNIIPDADPNKIVFIDGPLTKSTDTNVYNFTTSNLASSNLQQYRGMYESTLSNDSPPAVIEEPFIAGQYLDTDDENYLANFHYHNDISLIATGDVSYHDGTTVNPHSHTYENIGRRGHSHSASWSGENDGITSGNSFNIFDNYDPSDSNMDNWISPRKLKNSDLYAIEINIDKLNQAKNSCELAKLFNWSEQKIKCFNKN